MQKTILFFMILCMCKISFTQVTISGKVITTDGSMPVENAAIIFRAENKIVFSDSSGYFSVQLDRFEDFEISHIAYETIAALADPMVPGKSTPDHRSFTIWMSPRISVFNPVVVTANRADAVAPVTFSNINGEILNQNNFGANMPFLLEATPSAVATSDAGNSVGYTGLRIRGSDATRVNVSINGVPYNDAESEQTYWVDIADIAESVDDIQIQRGVGTSSFGISSLGGSVNIFTNKMSKSPYVHLNTSAGSFNLLKTSLAFGTGEINEHWNVEGRFSKVNADGYIDRSFADLLSWFFTASYTAGNYQTYINHFSTSEKTYQAWGGVPAEILDTNRTYNPYTYADQTDNYVQSHYQWHHILDLGESTTFQLTLNYTEGSGYYEQYEDDQLFSDYNAPDLIINTDTITASDMITQKWLDNQYYGAYFQVISEKKFAKITAGGAYYMYTGEHFGKIIWSAYAEPVGYDYEWYRNDAVKNDGNIFIHMDGVKNKLQWMADLQLRNVQYTFQGSDLTGALTDQQVSLLFFNPKIGLTWLHNTHANAYIFLGRSSKEPNRDDYTESSPDSRPAPETLFNAEIGERLQYKGWQFMADYYLMYYKDQLVLTGEINDVGAYTRTNIPSSYRTGIEIAWNKIFFEKLTWNANLSLSRNIISEYTEYVDNWDDGTQTEFDYSGSPIAFSPSVVGYDQLNFIVADMRKGALKPHNTFSVGLVSKYVGKQYADNSGSDARSLDAYALHDLSLIWNFSSKTLKDLTVTGTVRNLLNTQYESNAWVYRYIYENTEQQMMGFYPQAGINWVLSVRTAF